MLNNTFFKKIRLFFKENEPSICFIAKYVVLLPPQMIAYCSLLLAMVLIGYVCCLSRVNVSDWLGSSFYDSIASSPPFRSFSRWRIL